MPDIDLLNIDLLDQRCAHLDLFVSKMSWRHLQDMSSRRIQDMSWRHLQDMSSRRLQYMSSRRFARFLQDIFARRLQDMSSRRLEDQQMFAGIKRFGWLAKKKLHKKLIIFKLEHSEPYYYHYYY